MDSPGAAHNELSYATGSLRLQNIVPVLPGNTVVRTKYAVDKTAGIDRFLFISWVPILNSMVPHDSHPFRIGLPMPDYLEVSYTTASRAARKIR